MKRIILTIFFVAGLLNSLGCTKSGGDDDDNGDNGLSTNSCPVLGLPSKVINGTACVDTSSAVVELNIISGGGSQGGLCSGELIDSTHVLTAAHCFISGAEAIAVKVGGQFIPASDYFIAPTFKVLPDGGLFDDAAVVVLSQPANAPTLPIIGSNRVKDGDEVSVFGYGVDENGDTSVLKSGEMQVSDVNETYIVVKWDGKNGVNVCNGDSGGPALYTFNDGNSVVTGIAALTSFGSVAGCASGDTTSMTNLSKPSVLNFITSRAPGVVVK